MKKIFFPLVAIMLSISAFAQNDSKAKSLKGDIEDSNADIVNPKKEANPKTWMTRGELFYDAYGLNIHSLLRGMNVKQTELVFGQPKEPIVTTEVDGTKTETYKYSRINLTFTNGILNTWEETVPVVDGDPLAESVKSYEKAQSLDEKGKYTKKINEAYSKIATDLTDKALNEYALKQFKNAYNTAQLKLHLSKLQGFKDTTFYYYAGYFAFAQSEIDKSMWKEAVDNLEAAVNLGCNEQNIYILLYKGCCSLNDTLRGLNFIEKGMVKNPNDLGLIYELINYYSARNEAQKALEYIQKAKSSESGRKNASLFYVEGILHERMGNEDKALISYDEAIKIDPNFFNAWFYKGQVYVTIGNKYLQQANDSKTDAEFNKFKDMADKEYLKGLPILEKAHSINPKDKDVMNSLKQLYFRFRTTSDEMMKKYEDMSKKLNEA